jgi:hypothetical protein
MIRPSIAVGLLAFAAGFSGPVAARAPVRAPVPGHASVFGDWNVTVAGGPFAGSYKLSTMMQCSKDNPAKGTLAAGYDRAVDSAFTDDKEPIRKALKDPKSLNWMQLYVVPESGTGRLTVYFGKLDYEHGPSSKIGTRYEVETRSGKKAKGSGKFTVKPNGSGAVISFHGTSDKGVKLDVSVTCGQFF